jgi:hypothetical protein
MKITNGIKQDFNYKNNYKVIFKQIKEEIKSVVINKYINQVERLTKTIEKLKKENLLLKNDLIYILKRVLLNKNEYTNTNNNKNLTIYTKTQPLNRNSLTNTSLLNNNKYYNSFLSSAETINNDYNYYYCNYGNTNNSTINNPKEQRRYSIDDDFKKGNNNTTIIHTETSRQMSVQNKINYYLNSLYKHNFAEECVAGTASIHLLNKDQSIYDELFMNKKNRSKNKVLSRLNTDRTYKKISKSKAISHSKIKKYLSDKRKKQSLLTAHKVQKNKTNGYLKVKKKTDILNGKSNGMNIRKDNKKTIKDNKITININSNNNSKSSFINGSCLTSRSRFLVNKY